ncbi:hypothetical protein OJ996_16895 [Luteolibacter sp. GHJ8]|uniref:Cytochrome c domain-containing protein n=1 Tax=Luteolibacter rhizosphaerae TaxID=2989719 RepID=A0ABT3G5Z2_9BACT|nr:hypothetical protein [Luteolibacter rhizosphaerae]MCW1915267.1 hypothetical protein [Luteolibacter rhizosphaerae]
MKASLRILAAGALLSSSPAEESPLHQQILESLRTSDAVLPPIPHAAPVFTLSNAEAVVPPQCYTRTETLNNPCYVCHQDTIDGRENVMNDADLQEAYSFSDVGMTNHWKNLFEDRSSRIKQISDADITAWIKGDNYSELPSRLREANFKGWIPDLKNLHLGREAFDEQGFAKDGSQWVAFSYKPFPSTFWPTNGSTDDVMIRLPQSYRCNKEGKPSAEIYKANLAILEANIKGLDRIASLPVDETVIGEDLDGDGKQGVVRSIAKTTAWVGAARDLPIERSLYPEGTEFLHTVRYVGIAEDGLIGSSARMKEVRYSKKAKAYSKPMYARKYALEAMEKEAGNLPAYYDLGHYGLDNGNGWALHGFIEDHRGRLRAMTYEENFSCMGCHNSVGSTIDKTFSFPRKMDGPAGWGYLDLKGMPDAPNKGETVGEIATYLARAGGGSEFRNNDEMTSRWYRDNGTLDHEKLATAKDVYDLITPSRERALALNKAYKTIVEDQDFIYGKDPVLVPPKNVYDKIDNENSPTLPAERIFKWNILLDWPAPSTDR